MANDERVIGILGGMGPEATASLYKKIIAATEVSKDQDHFHVIVDSNPKIPDRTQAILYDGPSPVQKMRETAVNLQNAGATVLVMPCITAHYFYEDIKKAVTIPFYHVLRELNKTIDKKFSHVERIGVLSTTATRETRLFQMNLKGKDIIFPTDYEQEHKVMKAIYGKNGIKQGNTGKYPKDLLREVAERLIEEEQCELIIGGCTEVELVLSPSDLSVPFIDPMKNAASELTEK